MKRILLILSFLFLLLWVACLFYPGRTESIHIALIVALVFFIHSLIVMESSGVKKTIDTVIINQSAKNQDQDYDITIEKSDVKQISLELSEQDVKSFS